MVPAVMQSHPGLIARRVGLALLAGVSLGAAAAEANAQATIPEVGSTIRVSTDSIYTGRWVTGRYLHLDDQVLHMVSTEGDTLHVPRPALYRVEMSEGLYAHTGAGIVVGAAAGAIGAFLVRSVTCNGGIADSPEGLGASCRKHGKLQVTLLGAAGGGLLGGLIGTVTRSDRWLRLTVARFPRLH